MTAHNTIPQPSVVARPSPVSNYYALVTIDGTSGPVSDTAATAAADEQIAVHSIIVTNHGSSRGLLRLYSGTDLLMPRILVPANSRVTLLSNEDLGPLCLTETGVDLDLEVDVMSMTTHIIYRRVTEQ